MPLFRFLTGALCVFALVAGCTGTSDNQPADTPDPAVEETPSGAPGVALAPLLEAGSSGNTAAVLSRLRPPLRTETEPVENRHVPGQTDTLRTFYYDGLQLTVYDVTGSEKTLLQSLTVTDERYEGPQGLRAGMARAEVEEALGTPERREDGAYVYELGSDPTPHGLRVRFEGDAVSALEWSFYVD